MSRPGAGAGAVREGGAVPPAGRLRRRVLHPASPSFRAPPPRGPVPPGSYFLLTPVRSSEQVSCGTFARVGKPRLGAVEPRVGSDDINGGGSPVPDSLGAGPGVGSSALTLVLRLRWALRAPGAQPEAPCAQ